MKGGRWVKCVKTITEIFIEGEFYQIRDFFAPHHIILIDEFGNSIGFDISKDQVFKDHFKLGISQKRGTEWATRKQQ
jgi:hypothetical protein